MTSTNAYPFQIYGVDEFEGVSPFSLWSTAVLPEDCDYAQENLLAAVENDKLFDTVFRIERQQDKSICYIKVSGIVRKNDKE